MIAYNTVSGYMNLSFRKSACGIVFKVGGLVQLKPITDSKIRGMGIWPEYWHIDRNAKIIYVEDKYCGVKIGNDPIWNIEKIYLLNNWCMFGKEMT